MSQEKKTDAEHLDAPWPGKLPIPIVPTTHEHGILPGDVLAETDGDEDPDFPEGEIPSAMVSWVEEEEGLPLEMPRPSYLLNESSELNCVTRGTRTLLIRGLGGLVGIAAGLTIVAGVKHATALVLAEDEAIEIRFMCYAKPTEENGKTVYRWTPVEVQDLWSTEKLRNDFQISLEPGVSAELARFKAAESGWGTTLRMPEGAEPIVEPVTIQGYGEAFFTAHGSFSKNGEFVIKTDNGVGVYEMLNSSGDPACSGEAKGPRLKPVVAILESK